VKNPIEHFPGYMLRVASNSLMSELSQSLSTLNLRVSEATVLMFIHENPGIRQSEIGSKISIARANMAPLIGRLEKSGLLRKSPIDGRSYGLFLTEIGESTTSKVLSVVIDHEKTIENSIPRHIYKTFLETLKQMSNLDLD